MAMLTKEAQRLQIMRRLEETKSGETVCLWGWETEVLIDYIAELRHNAANCGNAPRKDDERG